MWSNDLVWALVTKAMPRLVYRMVNGWMGFKILWCRHLHPKWQLRMSFSMITRQLAWLLFSFALEKITMFMISQRCTFCWAWCIAELVTASCCAIMSSLQHILSPFPSTLQFSIYSRSEWFLPQIRVSTSGRGQTVSETLGHIVSLPLKWGLSMAQIPLRFGAHPEDHIAF